MLCSFYCCIIICCEKEKNALLSFSAHPPFYDLFLKLLIIHASLPGPFLKLLIIHASLSGPFLKLLIIHVSLSGPFLKRLIIHASLSGPFLKLLIIHASLSGPPGVPGAGTDQPFHDDAVQQGLPASLHPLLHAQRGHAGGGSALPV